MISTKRKLIAYSTLTSAFIFFTDEVSAQVVYTDLDPDIDIHEEFGFLFALINMDDDGPFDIKFEHGRDYTIDSFFGVQKIQEIWVGNFYFPGENFIAGSGMDFPPYGLAYAINENVIIDDNLNFTLGAGIMASRMLSTSVFDEDFHVVQYTGNWYPKQDDKYIGVKFKDLEDNFHFGWIRCTVKDKGRELIIKDYAYEKKIDFPIVAGSHETYNEVEVENILSGTMIYSNDNLVFITLGDEFTKDASISIYNLLGDCVLNMEAYQKSITISTNLASGIYLVQININGYQISKEIFIK